MTIAHWPRRRWLVALFGMVVAALAVGIPTDVVPTSLYQRMTPVLWWNYPIWAATAVLSGLIVATYVRTDAPSAASSRVGVGGNVLSLLAVGCPICNKLVVMAVGITGALNVWAPLQPVLGVVSLGLLSWALWRRLRGERVCRISSSPSAVPALSPAGHPDRAPSP